jgi:hypothetical protein
VPVDLARCAAPRVGAGSLPGMEIPPPDPSKLLAHWMEWERGDSSPGQVLKDLKIGGMRELLQHLAGGEAR